MTVIKQITDEIERVEGVKLLDVDPGFSTNRTVVTFVGTPDEVVEAAFQAVKKAQETIDMRHHKGDHPRFGATDVMPLIWLVARIESFTAVRDPLTPMGMPCVNPDAMLAALKATSS